MKKNHAPDPVQQALELLAWAHPNGPWVLTAIPAEGGRTTTETFHDPDAARGWIQRLNGHQNVYWTVNRVRGSTNKKPKKEGIEEAIMLHVDLDPRKGEDAQKEQGRILAALTTFSPAPSAIIFSGGGYQAFWRLDEPHYVGGDANRIAEIEAYNLQLARDLGGDHCFNIDRVMRLPGTINLPNKKKRDLGRVEALAEVVTRNQFTYPLSAFTPAAETKTNGAGAKVQLNSIIPRIKDLDELPAAVSRRTRMLIVQGDDPDDPTKYGSKSEVMWAVTCEMIRAGCEDDIIAGVLLDPDFGISEHPLRQKRSVEYVTRQIERARGIAWDVDPSGRRVLSFGAPYRTAQRLRIELYTSTIHINGDWLEYRDGAYILVEDRTMKSRLYRVLDDAVVAEQKDDQTVYQPFNPDPTKVRKVEEALQAVTHEEADAKAPPSWLSGDGPPPLEIISCRNGLLHLPTGELLPPTPDFFTRNALDIAYDPAAADPVQWQSFLRQLWPNGPEPDVLQEIFGCLLLPDTSLQKIFLLIGPPRSGKGTVLKLLVDLIGKANVCAPSISELAKDFGLEPLIGKQLAAITDMRLGKGANLAEMASNLLRISGEDDVSVNRKGKSYWTGRLAVRFLILGNELPRFNEDSPALARRFVPLVMTKSFLGREDRGLADRLRAELPGILNWAIAGWRRLQARGHFVLPPASEEAVLAIQERSSAIVSFLTECCDEGADLHVLKDEMYDAWRGWCGRYGEAPGNKGNLTRLLTTARPGAIRAGKPGTTVRLPSFLGVRLKPGTVTDASCGDGQSYAPWH
jgi:P4 family phage/plasmid primase-like protien